jgi:hypothetical protein
VFPDGSSKFHPLALFSPLDLIAILASNASLWIPEGENFRGKGIRIQIDHWNRTEAVKFTRVVECEQLRGENGQRENCTTLALKVHAVQINGISICEAIEKVTSADNC